MQALTNIHEYVVRHATPEPVLPPPVAPPPVLPAVRPRTTSAPAPPGDAALESDADHVLDMRPRCITVLCRPVISADLRHRVAAGMRHADSVAVAVAVDADADADVIADAASYRHRNLSMPDTIIDMPGDLPYPRERMALLLDKIFTPFINSENHAPISALIEDRLVRLEWMDIRPETLETALHNAASIDNWTAAFRGMVGSLGFIGGTQVAGIATAWALSHLPATSVPFVPGAIIGMVDQLYSGALERTRIGFHTQAKPHTLEPVMQRCMAQRNRSIPAECLYQGSVLAAPFTMRNIVRSMVTFATASTGWSKLIDTLIDGVGGIPAGAKVELMRFDDNRRRNLADVAYVLGSADWLTQLESLRHGAISTPRITDVGRRLSHFPWSQPPLMLLDSVQKLLSIDGLMEVVTLSIGLASLDRSKTAILGKFPDALPGNLEPLKNILGTTGLAALYFVLGILMTLASHCAIRLARHRAEYYGMAACGHRTWQAAKALFQTAAPVAVDGMPADEVWATTAMRRPADASGMTVTNMQ